MSTREDRARRIPTSDKDRAKNLADRLTLPQMQALVEDNRLPGEIAGRYGVTANVMLEAQRIVRRRMNGR